MKLEQVALQLFTLRHELGSPEEMSETLRRVRHIGYSTVEVFPVLGVDPQNLKKACDEVGLGVAGVSGTVRACEEKYLSRPSGISDERTVAFADADRRAVVREDGLLVRVGSSYVGATHLDT